MAKKGFFSWFRRKDEQQEQNADKTVLNQNENQEDIENKEVEQVSESSVEIKEEILKEEKSVLESDISNEQTVKSQEETADDSLNQNNENEDKDVNVQQSKELSSNEDSNETEVVVKNDEISVIDDVQDKEEKIPEPQQKPGFFKKLLKGLKKTRENIGFGFVALFKGRKIDDDLFEDLETALITADVGVETTTKILSKITSESTLRELKDADSLMKKLSEELHAILKPVSEKLVIDTTPKPFVILMVGVNGVGKTTTIGKMAKLFEKQGKKVMLAAGDTFRAAAVEQLKVWGQRNNIPVIAQETGADSASVIFDAISSAKAKGYDIVIADTAGRLQNKAYLMEELRKIVRVMKKISPDAPHEVMLTLDAGTGQNAISQAKLFGEVVPLTGINLTKLDGTAKGGVIFNIANQFKVPIRYIGIGEGIDDLKEFNADDFVSALFSNEQE